MLTNMDVTGEEGHPPLGLGYIASYLRKYSDFNNISIVEKESNLLNSIIRRKPDIVGIASVSVQFNNAVKLAEEIKKELDIPVIIGGQHITSIPHVLPNVFDLAVVGEGEETILELIKTFSEDGKFKQEKLNKIKGIAFYKDNKLVATQRRELIQPLDKIPYPARDLFKMKEHYLLPRKIISKTNLNRGTHMLTSRGCPYNCVFCASSCFWKHRIRFFSPEYVIGEMKELIEKYGVKVICIFDDLFIVDKKRLEKIVEMIKKENIEKQVMFRCSVRADLIDEKTCHMLKQMNVHTVSVGFESGSKRVLNYLKRNTAKVENNSRAAKLLKKYDFEIEGLFMIGSPYETREDMMKTMKFIKENDIDTIELCLTTPFPGTDLWEYAKQKGLVSDNMDWSLLDLQSVPDLDKQIFLNDQMSKEEFLQIYELFRKEVEKRNFALNLKASDILSKNLLKKGISNPHLTLKYLYFSMRRKLGLK